MKEDDARPVARTCIDAPLGVADKEKNIRRCGSSDSRTNCGWENGKCVGLRNFQRI